MKLLAKAARMRCFKGLDGFSLSLDGFSAKSRLALVLLSLVLVGCTVGCDRAPSADGLKEWTAADHDWNASEKATTSGKQGPKGAGGAVAVVEATWRAQCVSCHGPTGHGDGPQGAMVKAQDLSRDDWQSNVKDEEIASVILNGKGKMPKFELPADVVRGLVARVRGFRGQ